MMNIADKILHFYQKLEAPPDLPADIEVMNPYQNEESWRLVERFYHKYYSDQNERFVLFGINPGRFGGGITGIPFTDPIQLEERCDIQNSIDKKHELSSRFIYEMIEAFGGVKAFYSRFYISAMSPLGFIRNGKNLNYYDIDGWNHLFEKYAAEKLIEQLNFPLKKSVAFSIGQGENVKFLEKLNKKHQFFTRIESLPHPRWVMQYRLKRKDEFIDEYLSKLNPD